MGTSPSVNASSGGFLGSTAAARIERNLAMTPEADSFLADLSRRTGLKEGEVLRLALGMLKTAVDAKDQGKHFGVATDPTALDMELVGF